jgi:phospholipase/carboxylesterase
MSRRARVAAVMGLLVVALVVAACGTDEASEQPETGSTISEPAASTDPAATSLPTRPGERPRTFEAVPHVQIGVEPIPEVDAALRERAFLLPDVEKRGTLIGRSGADALWLAEDVPFTRPGQVMEGREFARFHPDGSLHFPLPTERALEAIEAGWADLHPWAGQDEFPDGFVMLYTPLTASELDVVLGLTVESYNVVT